MFYSIILYLVHKFISLFIFLQLLYRELQRYIRRWFNNSHRTLDKQIQFKKLPFHLGVVINEDHLAINDIASIINWCLCLGIHHVSIYDEPGYVKANNKYLYEEAIFQKDTCLKEVSQNFNIIFNDGSNPYSYNDIIKNGHITTDIHVYLLGHENGKQCIVDAAKNLCRDVSENPAILKDFHAKQFDHYVKDVVDIPDPQLIIKFGKLDGLLGYLPWHIRLTEIISYPSHHKLEFTQFQEFLLRYNRCEQRFGT